MTTITPIREVLIQEAVDAFEEWMGSGHHILVGDEEYIQPPVYLGFHLICMRVAGRPTDFDDIAVLSGASALFAHQPRDFGCKYAHLAVEPDRRIAEGTGFAFEWIDVADRESAWDLIRASVDEGKPVKGWDWENVLFVGYREAEAVEDRALFTLADGPETFAQWWTWEQFGIWFARMQEWRRTQLGRYAGRVKPKCALDVANRVLTYLATWSELPPETLQKTYPAASFGLAGMAAYAANCANVALFDDWTMCHDVNGQWTLRNSTAMWLRRLMEEGTLGPAANPDLEAAADGYRAAYETWAGCYELLGHDTTEAQRKDPARREDVADRVRHASRYERQAVAHLRHVIEEKPPS